MPCTTNSAHAQHTFLRGCCESSCPCPGIASYQAGKYCECNDTVAQNQPLQFRDELCNILGTLAGTYNNAAFQAAITAVGRFSSVRLACGTFTLFADTTTLGTVTNGVYTNVATLAAGTYTISINNTATPSCATVTITA